MNKQTCSRLIAWAAWVLITLDALTALLIPQQFAPEQVLLMIMVVLWLIGSLTLAMAGLIILYRRFFAGWPGWSLVIGFTFLTGVLVSLHFKLGLPANVLFFFQLIWISGLLNMGTATLVLLWHHDASVGLVGWTLATMVWIFAIIWRIQGNLVEIMISSMATSGESASLSWFITLFCLTGWVFVLGVPAFLLHTGKIIWWETRTQEM